MDKQTAILVTNIVLIAMLVGVGIYLLFNWEYAIAFVSDPCRLCEEKTGGACLNKIPSFDELQPQQDFPEYINTIK